MAAAHPKFTVWTRGIDDDGDWKQELTTDDLDAAQARAVEVGIGNVISTIYERGRFEVDGRHQTDDVMFWWSDGYHDAVGGAPDGRGSGWPDHHDGPVVYEPVGDSMLATAGSRTVASAAPARRYRQVYCNGCGAQVPQNEAHGYTKKVKVGSSSGSWHSGSSTTNRSSSRSSSSSSTQRSSYSSGRTYYREQAGWLCDPCYTSEAQAEANARRRQMRVLAAVAIVAFLYWALYGHNHV